MARDIETLTLQMSADIRRFEKSMDRMRATAERRLNEVERRTLQADRNLSRASGQIAGNMVRQFRDGLRGLAPVLAGAFSAAQVIRYADSYTALQNRLRAAGLEGQNLARVENELFEIANRNGVAVASTAELYQRATMARENLGASEAQLLRIVSGTAAALRVQGTSAQEASGALLQLGQLLTGNMVQAQEYNSLIDQLPVLLQAVANGSDRWGGSIASLTRDVKAGTVTAREFSDAMLRGFQDIERQAESAATTVGQALQALNNQLGRFIGQTDSGLSATQRMAQGIELLANNLDMVVTAGGAVTAVLVGRYTVAVTAATMAANAKTVATFRLIGSLSALSAAGYAATTALTGLRAAALFFVTNPVGLAITAVAASLVYLTMRGGEATASMAELDQRAASLEARLEDVAASGGAAADEVSRLGSTASRGLPFIAAMTGEVDKLADAHWRAAAAAKAQGIETARALMIDAGGEMLQAQEALARRRLREQPRVGGPVGGPLFGGAAGRPGQDVVGDATRAAERSAEARHLERVTRIYNEAQAQYERYIRAPLANFERADSGSPAPSGGAGSRGSGPAARDLEARRETLALQMALDVARARGDAAAVRALEERLELIRLARALSEAGYENAEEAARQQIALVNEATAAYETEEAVRQRALLTQRLQAEAAEDNARWAERQLAVQIDMARLAGDWTMVRRLEREADLRRRIAEYVERYGVAGYGMAIGEQNMADAAETEGRIRREMRGAAGAFLDALREGDMGSFFDAMGRRFADAAADNLTDLLMEIFKAARAGEGGGWMQSAGNAIGSWFGGGRALGGPVRPGKVYLVGEKRPELFAPDVPGRIIPQIPAMGAAPVNIKVVNNGAPVRAEFSRTADGLQVDLRPILRDGLKAMGAEGTLARAARQSPQPKRRG